MHLLVALDLSTATERTLATAIALARPADASVHLLHAAAAEPDFVGYRVGSPTVRDQVASEHREAHRQIQVHAQSLRDLGIRATALLIQGPAAAVILGEADRLAADFIVMATHGRSGLMDFVVGSVSRAVLVGARVPVILVPGNRQHPAAVP